MSQPLITVITPAYNSGDKLDRTIESVLAQAGVDIEYWVIDGGSKDDTVERLRQYGDKIQWISEPDKGVYDAMNKGIDRSSGRYLYFIGAGDVVRPGAFAEIAPHLQSDEPTFVYGDVNWLLGDRYFPGGRFGGEFDKKEIVIRCPCHQAVFYHRSIFELEGKYEPKYKNGADWVINIRCFGDDRVSKVYVPMMVAEYEGGGVSSTSVDRVFHRERSAIIAQYLGIGYMFYFWKVEIARYIECQVSLTKYLRSKSWSYLWERIVWHTRRRLGFK